MLVGLDLRLHSSHRYQDSLMDIIKETMLKQDSVFRMQVHELHRLYQVQKLLSKDVDSTGLHKLEPFNGAPPQFYAVYNKHDGQYGSPSYETKSSLTEKVISTNAVRKEIFKRPFDLRLSADEFISNVTDDCQDKGNKSSLSGMPVVPMNYLSGSSSYEEEDMGLLLKCKEGGSKSWVEKATGSCHRNVLDLDDSVGEESCSHGNFHKNYANRCHGELGVLNNVNLVHKKETLFDEFVECSSSKEKNKSYQEQPLPRQGSRECYDGIVHENLPSRMQKLSTAEGGFLDLNEPFIDDSSRDSNVPLSEVSAAVAPLTAFTVPHTASVNCLIQSATTAAQCTSIYDDRVQVISGGNIDDNQSAESKHKLSYLDDLQHKPRFSGTMSSEKIAGETTGPSCVTCPGSKILEGKGDHSLISWQSCCSDDHSSSSKSIRSSQPSIALNNGCACINLRSKPACYESKTVADQGDFRTKSGDLKESEILQRAAESLVHLSNAKSAVLGLISNSNPPIDEIENEVDEKPQDSADSFEHIVLRLTENNLEDETASSKLIHLNGAGGNDYSTKLRRGRRLKDFQKEILPSIVSLAVQEIREDINIMEGVLRSREYRKRRAKMAIHDHNWCIVKRSRRSRLQHVRRRIFT